jgi:HlyD family secretion protein
VRKRSWYLLLAGAALLLAIVFSPWVFREDRAGNERYRIATVKRGKILSTVTCTGTVNPLNTVIVGSQVSGNIQAIYVDFNSEVEEGQIIARIDPAVYSAQLEQTKAQLLKAQTQLSEAQRDIEAARAGVISARANVASAKANLKQTSLQYERLDKLLKKETVSQSEFDAISAQRDTARSAVEVAEAILETAKAQLARALVGEKGIRALITEREAALGLAEVKLQYCTIVSPIDGVVISREVDVGQTVAASLQSPVLFTIAEDLKRMQVEADVSEADVGRIKSGQSVEFTVDAFLDTKFQATVRQVRNAPTNILNVVTYKVIADVNNDSLLLRPGMTANVTVVIAMVDEVLKVPNRALRFRPPGETEETKGEMPRAVKEMRVYRNTVSRLGLDEKQSKELEKIIDAARSKLKWSLQEAQDDEDQRQALRAFLTQVFTKLRPILKGDQPNKLREIIQELKALRSRNARRAKVYTLAGGGVPKALTVLVGITDESETQVIAGDLKEGDRVIVGLESGSSQSARKSSTHPLIRMLTPGRRR